MGTPDFFAHIQLKVGNPIMRNFEIGDEVPSDIPDGVYVAYEGVVVINNRKFIAQFPCVHTKWGNALDNKTIMHAHNPAAQMVDEFVRNKKDF